MSLGICVITAGLPSGSQVAELLDRCGIPVWTPASNDGEDGSACRRAMCLIIDMPGRAGLDILELVRRYGITTPAILVVDRAGALSPEELKHVRALDALPRPLNRRDLLRWIECICVARQLVRRLRKDTFLEDAPVSAAA